MSTESIDDKLDKLFERVNTTWSDFYDVHTLSGDEPDVDCIHLTPKAKAKISDLIKQSQLKARIDELNRYDTDEDMYKTLRTADLQNQV